MTEINPKPGIGHNTPDFADVEAKRLTQDYTSLGGDVAKMLADVNAEVPATVASDADLGVVNKFVVDMRDLSARVETFRTTEKEPHLRRGQAVDQFFKGMTDRLAKAMKVIGARGDVYNDAKIARERARLAAERLEAERVAREAQRKLDAEQRARDEAAAAAARARKQENIDAHQAKADEHAAAAAGAKEEVAAAVADVQDAAFAAVAPPAEIARVRSDDGYLSTVKQVPFVEVVDASKLNKDLLWPFLKEEHILLALKAYGKTTSHKRPMEGAIIEMRNATVYR